MEKLRVIIYASKLIYLLAQLQECLTHLKVKEQYIELVQIKTVNGKLMNTKKTIIKRITKMYAI